jgi:UPF0271 protein
VTGGPPAIDLNADLGEGFGAWRLGDDEALLAIVTSANIACGFHAGDPLILRRCCAAAVARGVAIGAQVSYRDLAGFGIARAEGGRVRYVKPHGALYNRMARDPVQAVAVAAAVAAYDRSLPLLTLPGSAAAQAAADAGLRAAAEAFADRAYTAEGRLVSRREPGAVLSNVDEVTARAVGMATRGRVTAADGREVTVEPESICVHGDTPGAVELARSVRRGLETAGVRLASFT